MSIGMAASCKVPPGEGSNATVDASRLCSLCRDMCFKSKILLIDFVSGDDEQLNTLSCSNGLKQEAFLLGYKEDDQGGVGISELFIHHKTKRDLELSAALGCHLCALAVGARWNLYAEIILDELDDSEEEQEDKRKEEELDEAICDPTPPNVIDWAQATITPLDPDYTGPLASEDSRCGFYFSNGGWTPNANNAEGEGRGNNEAERINGLEIRETAISAEEVKKLKTGIWCEIFARDGKKWDHVLSFTEYVPYNNKSSSGLSILRHPGELTPVG